jgi:hypothetical protein
VNRRPRPVSSWLTRGAAATLGLVLLESLAFVALWLNDGAAPTGPRRAARITAVLEAAGAAVSSGPPLEVVHPYLGFVYNPEADTPALQSLHHAPISRFGFFGPGEPARGRRPDQLVVGLFGGSFASWTFLDARRALEERLERDPRLAGRDVVVLDLALGGYKQPQQLLALAYLGALGVQLDAVVNLDGFNEVVLPVLENLPKGVALSYPRNWYLRTTEIQPGPVLRLVARVDALEARRASLATLARLPVVRSSSTVHLLWRAADRALTRRLGHIEGELMRAKGDDRRFASTGPPTNPGNRSEAMRELVLIWRDASLQMDRLTRGNGGRYLHFLQPNQYLEGSKPLGAAERDSAVDDRSPYPELVREGYPLLQAAGRELVAAGVDFHDLTGLFAGVEEPLYRDTCCHVNTTGSEMVATAVADAILAGPL